MKRQLGEKFPKIEGIGCYKERKTLTATQVADVFKRDLQKARTLSQDDPTGYFARKAVMIDASMKRFKEQGDGRMYDVGYEPGLKYVYPGLPVDFAEFVDTAIRDVVDLIAQSREVAFTGLCCAGHPSAVMKNPNFVDNPGLTMINRMNSELGEWVYAHNHSPYLTVLLEKDVSKDLLGIHVDVQEGDAGISISAHEKGPRMFYKGFPRLAVKGNPRLRVFGERVGFREFVALYQKALSEFWARVQEVFEGMSGIRVPGPGTEHFTGAASDWDFECTLSKERIEGGMNLPNYYYFFGNRSTVRPEFAHSDKTHGL